MQEEARKQDEQQQQQQQQQSQVPPNKTSPPAQTAPKKSRDTQKARFDNAIAAARQSYEVRASILVYSVVPIIIADLFLHA